MTANGPGTGLMLHDFMRIHCIDLLVHSFGPVQPLRAVWSSDSASANSIKPHSSSHDDTPRAKSRGQHLDCAHHTSDPLGNHRLLFLGRNEESLQLVSPQTMAASDTHSEPTQLTTFSIPTHRPNHAPARPLPFLSYIIYYLYHY